MTTKRRDFQKNVTTDGRTVAGQRNPYVPLSFAGDTITITISNEMKLTVKAKCQTLVGKDKYFQ